MIKLVKEHLLVDLQIMVAGFERRVICTFAPFFFQCSLGVGEEIFNCNGQYIVKHSNQG